MPNKRIRHGTFNSERLFRVDVLSDVFASAILSTAIHIYQVIRTREVKKMDKVSVAIDVLRLGVAWIPNEQKELDYVAKVRKEAAEVVSKYLKSK